MFHKCHKNLSELNGCISGMLCLFLIRPFKIKKCNLLAEPSLCKVLPNFLSSPLMNLNASDDTNHSWERGPNPPIL